MPERRDSKFVLWFVAVLLVVLLAYPLSFGPVCWPADRNLILINAILPGYGCGTARLAVETVG